MLIASRKTLPNGLGSEKSIREGKSLDIVAQIFNAFKFRSRCIKVGLRRMLEKEEKISEGQAGFRPNQQCIGETEDLNSKKRISLVSLRAHAKAHTPTTTAVLLA